MRPQTRNRLIVSGVAVAVAFSAIALIVSLVRGGSTTVQQTSAVGPSVAASTSPSTLLTESASPSDDASSGATPATPATTTASSTPSTSLSSLPQGTANPVDAPKGTTPAGVTSGDLSTNASAPDYSVKISTATVNRHWGFTYSFQCDPSADDTWRVDRPKDGSFSVRLGNNYLVAGNTYEGSGFAEVHSDSGPTTHELVIGGPCSYELHYVSYSN